jgi:hypothetical protein
VTKPNRFKPTALQRVQQAQGAWSAKAPVRPRTVVSTTSASPMWSTAVIYSSTSWGNYGYPVYHGAGRTYKGALGHDINSAAVHLQRALWWAGMNADMGRALVREGLKEWRSQRSPVADGDVQRAVEDAYKWALAEVPGIGAATLLKSMQPPDGAWTLLWLDAYIALLED